jgi:hypothetical protein
VEQVVVLLQATWSNTFERLPTDATFDSIRKAAHHPTFSSPSTVAAVAAAAAAAALVAGEGGGGAGGGGDDDVDTGGQDLSYADLNRGGGTGADGDGWDLVGGALDADAGRPLSALLGRLDFDNIVEVRACLRAHMRACGAVRLT